MEGGAGEVDTVGGAELREGGGPGERRQPLHHPILAQSLHHYNASSQPLHHYNASSQPLHHYNASSQPLHHCNASSQEEVADLSESSGLLVEARLRLCMLAEGTSWYLRTAEEETPANKPFQPLDYLPNLADFKSYSGKFSRHINFVFFVAAS